MWLRELEVLCGPPPQGMNLDEDGLEDYMGNNIARLVRHQAHAAAAHSGGSQGAPEGHLRGSGRNRRRTSIGSSSATAPSTRTTCWSSPRRSRPTRKSPRSIWALAAENRTPMLVFERVGGTTGRHRHLSRVAAADRPPAGHEVGTASGPIRTRRGRPCDSEGRLQRPGPRFGGGQGRPHDAAAAAALRDRQGAVHHQRRHGGRGRRRPAPAT